MRRNTTTSELAKQLGISHQSVSKWLSGENYPSIENLLLMSQIFDVTLDDLFKKDMMGMTGTLRATPEYEKNAN